MLTLLKSITWTEYYVFGFVYIATVMVVHHLLPDDNNVPKLHAKCAYDVLIYTIALGLAAVVWPAFMSHHAAIVVHGVYHKITKKKEKTT